MVWKDVSWMGDTLVEEWITVRNSSVPGTFSEYYNLWRTKVRSRPGWDGEARASPRGKATARRGRRSRSRRA